MKYYEVHRTRTCKAVNSKEGYSSWDRTVDTFDNLAEIKSFLAAEYGKCKRTKNYIDGNNGEAIHKGYCYHYNTPKASYDDQPKNNCDWVHVREIQATNIIVK